MIDRVRELTFRVGLLDQWRCNTTPPPRTMQSVDLQAATGYNEDSSASRERSLISLRSSLVHSGDHIVRIGVFDRQHRGG
jgi:hypothetical protein